MPPYSGTGPIVSHIRNPDLAIPGRFHNFHGCLYPGLGRSHGGFPDFMGLDLSDLKLHINLLELKGVIFALQHWVSVLQGHQVMIATDNTTVVAYINKQVKQGGTYSHTLLRLVVDLFLWLQSHDIHVAIRARHIPGCLNVIADRLSWHNYQPIATEWSLHPEVVKLIFRLWGTPVVDMFATIHNTHLPQFMFPVPEPRALAIDVLSQDWQGWSMYIFPPFPLLNRVIQKLRKSQERS